MCFWIDRGARRPQQTIAWKVMRLCHSPTGGYLYSMNYFRHDKYTIGDTMIAKTEPASPSDDYAKGGVYVYTNESEAWRWQWKGCVVVKMYVDPVDWLQTSSAFECLHGRIRTYKKARIAPAKEQPYIQYAPRT